jgi:hypothetical protein
MKNPKTKPKPGTPESKFATIVKWAGGITVLMTLATGIYQFTESVYERRERQRHVAELLQVAENQRSRNAFAEAWENLEAARKLKTNEDKIDRSQEDLAMAWLENVHVREGQSFTQIVSKIEPILDRGLQTAEPQRKGDLQAHLGWATFLRHREGGPGTPEPLYQKALQFDPQNAHAMLGHWILWTTRDLQKARTHFEAATASGRAESYVRRLQFAALTNVRMPEADIEMIRVANESRKKNQTLDPDDKTRIWDLYASSLRDGGDVLTERARHAMPQEEHLSTFRWLFEGESFSEDRRLIRDYWLGILQAASGQRAEALQTLSALSEKLQGRPGLLQNRTEAAIARLSGRP